MNRFIFALGLWLALPLSVAAQTTVLPIPPMSNVGVVVVPSSAVNGAGTSSVALKSSAFCVDATTQDAYMAEVAANDLGFYTGGTNCSGGTVRLDLTSTRALFAVPAYLPDGTTTAPSLTFAGETTLGFGRISGGVVDVLGGSLRLRATGATLFFDSTGTGLLADANDILAQRRGTNSQISKIYQSYTDGSNGRWLALYGNVSANMPGVYADGNGTGANPSLYLGSAGGNTIMLDQFSTKAGTTSAAPIILTNGTNLTTATANAVENDGTRLYFTQNTTNGRAVDDNWNFFELTGDGTGITTIADFFGATGSGIPLVANARYEIEWHCVFTQATAGTATWTIVTATTALANLEANYIGSNIAGLGTVGAPQMAGTGAVTGSSSTALPVTGTEATGVSHSFDIHAMITAGNGTSNTRLRLTMSAGTATPKAGSYIKVRQLPAANTGTFVN